MMSEEAHRIWTEGITGNKLVAEYSDGDYLIHHDEWSLLFEPAQMRALLKFVRTADSGDEKSLGENSANEEMTVRYQNESYQFDGGDVYGNPSVSTEEMDEVETLVA
jgi:hypothetical protein